MPTMAALRSADGLAERSAGGSHRHVEPPGDPADDARTDRIRARTTTLMFTISWRSSSLVQAGFMHDPAADETSSRYSSIMK
jgi:hypothetical protein